MVNILENKNAEHLSKEELIGKLTDLADQMFDVGTSLEYFLGFDEASKHGRELIGASLIVRDWIEHLNKGIYKRDLFEEIKQGFDELKEERGHG